MGMRGEGAHPSPIHPMIIFETPLSKPMLPLGVLPPLKNEALAIEKQTPFIESPLPGNYS